MAEPKLTHISFTTIPKNLEPQNSVGQNLMLPSERLSKSLCQRHDQTGELHLVYKWQQSYRDTDVYPAPASFTQPVQD